MFSNCFKGYHDDDQFNSRTYFSQLEQTSQKVLGIIRNSLITFSAIK